MKPLDILKQLSLEDKKRNNPSFPVGYLPVTKYTDTTANGLTKCIKDFLNLSGHQAERINTMGIFMKGRTKDHGHLSHEVHEGKYRKGTGTKGSADISATIRGRSVKIEIKMKDSQSPEQRRYQADIERVGGVYVLFRNFDDFHRWYEEYINKLS